ncbi:TylF/MycF/NovP-related O-methyltransferase [Aeoliella mucimassa]|uniref:Demethyldecarbamoylnovobiocin O-methyltransferase n=1 Tax=Aeoliella mucimassa TaxID=2527972 RepID=A0A518AKV1_9BACT|nr:TylF/MycF/NovP-related O-methyltransferase [Aeoliella mucimassa]QDU55350.1 Demethyldecarbamoylnovobiocin O-methyltransferase [Aeoliella mucimassa]
MDTSAFSDPYTDASLFKKTARLGLTTLHRILPARAYAAVYHPLFSIYQQLQRGQYRSKLNAARRAGDQDRVTCMQRVLKVMPHSLIGSPGLEHTHDLAEQLVKQGVPGAFVECGVAQGGCAALIATVADSDPTERTCWFFDSFEGLPDPTSDDFADGETGRHIRPLPKGSCLGTIEQVSGLLFDDFQLSRDKITLVKGWFQDTLEPTRDQIEAIALLRVDGDWYDSTKCCLEALFDQVSPGGQIIIDDYCSCYGAKRATDEFIANRDLQVKLLPDGRGGCSFQKPTNQDQAMLERQVA